jgi:hypothetical protein
VKLNIRELLLSIILALILAVCLSLALNCPSVYKVSRAATSGGVDSNANIVVSLEETSPYASDIKSTSPPFVQTTTITPTQIPLRIGGERGEDVADVLLLYDSASISSFDMNFCMIAEYYGLLCKKVDVRATYLTDEILRDTRGNYFKLIGVAAETILQKSTTLTQEELNLIKRVIEAKGISLLVSEVNENSDLTILADLTWGVVSGVTKPLDSNRDWVVSSMEPEITRELTGKTFYSTSTDAQGDFSLTLSQQIPVTSLILSNEDAGVSYPIFVRLEKGLGSVYIDAGERAMSFEEIPLREMYYDTYYFSNLLSLMFTIRYVLGSEAWHSAHDFANLTIDDATLTEPFGQLSFIELLPEMEAHNFHTTIAMHPVSWFESEPEVVTLFLANPNRYSLVQHGNNGDGYEFYKYDVLAGDEYEGMILPARPLVDQEADIVQGLARMEQHRIHTGIPFDRIMIFPWGISPEHTLELLKKYNFLATINRLDVPLDAIRPSDWDYGMYLANMEYGNFPTLSRRYIQSYETYRSELSSLALDLLVDKPILVYTHVYEGQFFDDGIDEFDPIADYINDLHGEVEWCSLGYIIKHLYLEKTNDDGSVDVKMYGNHLIVTNRSSRERTYHIIKEENLNIPISLLTVNGYDFPYHIDEGIILVSVLVPANTTLEIMIQYGKLSS